MSTELKCWMWFYRTSCTYKAKHGRDLERHISAIHAPEALSINRFDPGNDRPYMTHINRVFLDGRIEKSVERFQDVANLSLRESG